MARSRMPDPIRRRHLLERELAPAEALAIAEAYLREERTVEAIAFLAKAGARDRLDVLREEAVVGGDAFLLREVSAALGEEAGPERWRALRDAARAAGRDAYARDAERQAERGEMG